MYLLGCTCLLVLADYDDVYDNYVVDVEDVNILKWHAQLHICPIQQ